MRSKLTALAIVGGMIVAPIAFAQTNVLSQNAVGYVKVSIDVGDLALVSHDFVDIDGLPTTISDVIGDQLPNGSAAFIWDEGGQAFMSEDYVPAGKGLPPTWQPDTAVIEPGVGFFIEAANLGGPTYEVFMLGEVPSVETNDLTTVPGFTMLGYPYPATEDWTNTALAAAATQNDELFLWDQGSQAYTTDSFVPAGKGLPPTWSNPARTIDPGVGFFYDSAAGGPVVATETKPYAWP